MKARYFFIAAVACALLSVLALRANADHAGQLRAQIHETDEASRDVEAPLEQLRQFVFAHMNSSVTLELTASYERAVKASQTPKASTSRSAMRQAVTACKRSGVSSAKQPQCIKDYLVAAAPQQGNADVQLPDRSLFIYAFVSPAWTPDIAGFALLSAIVLALAAILIYILSSFRRPS